MSLTYALPCGGEDINTPAGDLRLTAQGGDAFRAGDEADSRRCRARCYSTTPARCAVAGTGATACAPCLPRARRTRSHPESVDPARHDDLAAALDDSARTQAALGGGEMESHIVTKDSPVIALS